ncbi:MAG: hypothetical protein V2I40_13060 [Desulfobacteraceae bacterium]|nr:hypothetical protein [Desulfobacteraceae bacterium]
MGIPTQVVAVVFKTNHTGFHQSLKVLLNVVALSEGVEILRLSGFAIHDPPGGDAATGSVDMQDLSSRIRPTR